MQAKKWIFLILVTKLILTKAINKIKEIEKCLIESFNPTDREFKVSSDLIALDVAIRDFPLLTKSLQKRFRRCRINIEEQKKFCEEIYGFNNCEPCGMIHIKKCPPDFERVDCGLCARKCPEETVPDALGALCAKPKMIKKKIYSSFIECKKAGNEECKDYSNFATNICPKSFIPIGDFLCNYECPEGFQDSEIYCIPEIIETNEYFFGNYGENLHVIPD
jgi:hypothetical protein